MERRSKRRISTVATGPPIKPPQTMPAMAEATAIDSAPVTPAFSNRGAKASPVAGPPVSVVEPASTPNSGCKPNPIATAIPSRFWAMANTEANSRNTTTWRPLIFSSNRLAFIPMVVKNAIISGLCSEVSSTNNGVPWLWPAQAAKAKTSPPMTGGGRL